MATDETTNLRYCYDVLCRRITDKDDRSPYWRMKLKVATYFLKRYDDRFDPDAWDYGKELSDREEGYLLVSHPLLQATQHETVPFQGSIKELQEQMRKRVQRFFERRARAAGAPQAHH
jgi:hypothetical protein